MSDTDLESSIRHAMTATPPLQGPLRVIDGIRFFSPFFIRQFERQWPFWLAGIVALTLYAARRFVRFLRRQWIVFQFKQRLTEPMLGTFGVDIGGTLAKVVYLQPDAELASDSHLLLARDQDHLRMKALSFRSARLNGTLHFLKFPTHRFEPSLRMVRTPVSQQHTGMGTGRVYATGGGAFKFKSIVQEKLGVMFETKVDEMESLVSGLRFLLNYGKADGVLYHLQFPLAQLPQAQTDSPPPHNRLTPAPHPPHRHTRDLQARECAAAGPSEEEEPPRSRRPGGGEETARERSGGSSGGGRARGELWRWGC
jgi:hypothetical protein